jgi:hypothetical protein
VALIWRGLRVVIPGGRAGEASSSRGSAGMLSDHVAYVCIKFLVPYESASTSASHARDIAAGVASHEQHIYIR